MPELTPEQNEQYYRARLDPYRLHHSKGSWWRAICPIHRGSNNTQLSVNFAEGNFRCFSCGEKGRSAYFFEQKLLAQQLNRSPLHDEVQAALEAILKTPLAMRVYPQELESVKTGTWDIAKARDKFVYTDEEGFEVYTVYKFVDRKGNKKTPACRPCICQTNPEAECEPGCHEGRIWNLDAVRRVLYRLPDVMQAMFVFIVEGEKNANDLSREMARYISKHGGFMLPDGTYLDRVAVTTNSHGASSWKKEHKFGPFFYRKTVIKLGDNDVAGRLHDEAVCEDVKRYARRLYTLALPVGEGEDISDYLANHTIEDFARLLPQRVEWETKQRSFSQFSAEEDKPRMVLIKPSKLLGAGGAEERDWLVPGLIARGKRGLVVAPPKTGKSLLFCDLALCLATNRGFLGSKPYGRPVKCALISREDGPDELYFRLKALGAGRGLQWPEIDQHLSVNTEVQTSRFKIDNARDLQEMAEWLKADKTEFVVLDVLNRLHTSAENSSDEMTKVMQHFDELALLSGAQVCVIHHTNKGGGVKGSTSIEGWADYIIRLEPHPDDDSLKTLLLRTKSSSAVPPRTLRYEQSDDKRQSRIMLVEARPAVARAGSRPRLLAPTGSGY